MNVKKNGSASRSYRNIKLAPTTRAIRSALALSATLLALSGSGAALAGTCAVTGLNEVTCTGVFTDDVTNSVPVINIVPDLTLIVDGAATVDPGVGANGVTSTWGGDATVINYGAINVEDANGIYLSTTDGSGTVENYGDIYALANAADATGIYAYSYYDTTVVNGGEINAAATTGTAYNATGIYAASNDGVSTVDNSGTVTGTAYNGTGTGIQSVGYYGSDVTNSGFVGGSSFTYDGIGILSVGIAGDSNVENSGTVEAYSLTGEAYGVISVSVFYDASVDNSGLISAGAETAQGVLAASVYGNATVDNSGTVNAYGEYYGMGIGATAYYDATVNNSGSVYASGKYNATGILAVSFDGYATVTTAAGSYTAASSKYDAVGISANGYYGATVDNAGSVYAYAGGYGFGTFQSAGIEAYSYDGDASVTNSGYVGAVTYAGALNGDITSTGAYAGSYYGSASIDNSGTISATTIGYAYYEATSYGAQAYSYDGDATVTNSGEINASVYGAAPTYYGTVLAAGAVAVSYNGNAAVDNSGTINADAGYYGYNGVTSYGAVAVSVNGDASVTNSGEINSSAYGYGYYNGVDATGVYVYSGLGTASVDNSGVINATATNNQNYVNYYGAEATGVNVVAFYYDAVVDNSGTINATAYSSYYSVAGGSATGIFAYGYTNVDVANSGEINVSVYGGTSYYAGQATGIQTSSKYTSYVDNSGTINVSGDYYTNATGVDSYAKYGSYVDNSGVIDVYSYGANAVGVSSYGKYGSSTVTNSGDIYAASNYGNAFGISSVSQKYGDSVVDNSGLVDAHSVYGVAVGIAASTGYGYYGLNPGSVSVDNSGTINATSDYGVAAGIYAFSYYDVDVNNSGQINVSGYLAAYGVIAYSVYGDINVDNSGEINVYAGNYGYYAFGVKAQNFYSGDVNVDNSGTISVAGYTGGASYVDDATFGPYVYGVWAKGFYDVNVTNSGIIDVSATSYSLFNPIAMGVYADSIYGDTTVDNSGTISVLAEGFNVYYAPVATGVQAYSKYGDVVVNNSGLIDVTAQEDYIGYFGNVTTAMGVYAISLYGNVTVDNSGEINATATALYGGPATIQFGDATAIGVSALGVFGYDFDGTAYGLVSVNNTGTITATATSGAYGYYSIADATGVSAISYLNGYVQVTNDGLIEANAYTGYNTYFSSAVAHGVVAEAFEGYYHPVTVYNSGTISATAVAGYGDYAYDNQADAYGVSAYSYDGNIEIENQGLIEATASAGGYYGYSNAVGIDAVISPYGYGIIDVYNGGVVTADAGTHAIGVRVRSDGYYGVNVNNSGTIAATADYMATGIWLDSDAYAYVYNTGLISATGADYNVAIDATTSGAYAVVLNYGTITGAFWGSNYNDYLYNGDGGVWNPGTTPSYFGDGDDVIVNVGTINMNNSVIDLGYHDVTGNYFYNYGVINVNGDNLIHMGHGPAGPAVPSLNPNPFYNGGVIDFQDGAANDYLLIVGDFAGDGDINVDVSGLTGDSDILYIDGSVVTGTVGTINVNLLDLPNVIETTVPMVYVSGDSVASNFVLGDVVWDEDNSFVTLDFDLIADIDPTNATPDVFSLGIEVSGLSDPGTLAAALPGSVQSLMNSQVGTWRQRMGVIDSFTDGAVALWARIWTDKGGFEPDHDASNFGQGGNFDWEQKNSGVEAGVDFSVTDEFSIGLLIGQSEADIDLEDPGHGSADIDANTWGVYGTWISPTGFYLDASFRWMSFDIDMESVAGPMDIDGDAQSFNIEVGYAWTLAGGLKIEPQLQYTKTTIDEMDALVTTNGMEFNNEDGDSSRGRFGVALRKSFGEADAGWMWTPYATISVVREFDGENHYNINNVFHGETTLDGTSTLLELGFTARHQNWSIYGGLNWMDGGAVDSFFGGQLGVRYTFGSAPPPPPPPPAPAPKTCAELDDDGDGVNNCDDKCLGSTAGEQVGPDGCPVPPPEPVMEPKPFRG